MTGANGMIGVGVSIPETAVTSGISPFSDAANALFARMTTPPSDARRVLINALIVGLQTDGLWNLLDALYLTAAANTQAGTLNWKSSSYTLTESGTGTWTVDRGWAGDGISGRLSTGVAPASLTNLLQDSATAFVWSRTAAQSANPCLGLSANQTFQLNPRSTGDSFNYRINQSTTTNAATADGSGLFSASRTGASATQSYRNGAALGAAGAIASAARSANAIVLGGNVATYATTQIAAAGFGAGLDATQNANLYTRLNTYLTAIGAA